MTTSEHIIIPERSFTQLSDYETWASQNWLHQDGTLDAQLHARGKLDEEVKELIEALDDDDSHEIISEAGDVLWTAHASGLNTDIPLSQSLHDTFPLYFPDAQITAADIDEAAYEHFDGVDKETTQEYLAYHELHLSKAAKQWFKLRDVARPSVESFADAYIHLKHSRATFALANMALAVSYVAQEFAGASIEDVMQDNYQKIEQRIKAGAAVTKNPRVSY
ncbi:MAG: MazG nucleotide pyrophosphohydrolase domain-containing protein [Candidatus Microsaccharimonas sp.]